MCIIVIKHEGNTLTKETVETCFHNNNDGAGFMYFDEERKAVVGDKGYMTVDRLWEGLKRKGWIDAEDRITAERGLVMHFRLGTHGSNTAPLTHPFPISSSEADLRLLNWEAEWGVAHNGVIGGMVDYNSKKNISDTMVFVKDYLADDRVLESLDHGPCVKLMFMGMRSSNKFAFLNSEGQLILIGLFYKGQDGNVYSNSTFQQKVVRYNTYGWGRTREPATTTPQTQYPTPAVPYPNKLVPSDGKLLDSCGSISTSCAECRDYQYYPYQAAVHRHYCFKERGYLLNLIKG